MSDKSEEQFEFARAKLEDYCQDGSINQYKIEKTTNGHLRVVLDFTFDPSDLCLKIIRLTPPGIGTEPK
jgi:hypothetical protein